MFENLEPGERLVITFTDQDRYKGGVNFLGFPVVTRQKTNESLPLHTFIDADTLSDPTQVLLEVHQLIRERVTPRTHGTRGLLATFEAVLNSGEEHLPVFDCGLETAYGHELIRDMDVTHIVYVLEAAGTA